MNTPKTYFTIAGVACLILGWVLFLYFVPAEEVVAFIGVENAYLAGFLMALIAGFSSITATSFYVAAGTLAQGGVNPVYLGIACGIGLFISDSLFYALVLRGRKSISGIWKRTFERIAAWMDRVPDVLVYAVVFFYIALAPIPNDILLVALAISGYRYRSFALFLLAGDMVFAQLLTHLTQ